MDQLDLEFKPICELFAKHCEQWSSYAPLSYVAMLRSLRTVRRSKRGRDIMNETSHPQHTGRSIGAVVAGIFVGIIL